MSEKSYCINSFTKTITLRDEILEKYLSIGEEKGILGYPTENEYKYNSEASFTVFQKGVIVTGKSSGTFVIKDKYYRHWADNLGFWGKYKLPLSDSYIENGIEKQKFQGGIISSDCPCIKNKSDLRGEIARRGISIRNQGPRGTCSVQTMVFLLEYMYTGLLGKEFNFLSVEYANHYANIANGRDCDGDFFSNIASGYEKYGIIKEKAWPYNKDAVYDVNVFEKAVPKNLIENGRKLFAECPLQGHFVKEWSESEPGLNGTQFEEMLSYLDRGIPLGVGRGHSLPAIAYERDENQDGGGIMIFRNSYGSNDYFTGYQVETFDNVMKTVFDVYVFE